MKKRVLLLASITLWLAAGRVEAQTAVADSNDWLCPHCQQIAKDYYHSDATLEELGLVPYKVAFWCMMSHASLFVTDELPEGAFVYDIHEVKNVKTGMYLPTDFVVNLDSLSLYAYNFADFEQRHYGSRIYFRTAGSEHAYLVLRGRREVDRMVYNNKDLQGYLSYPDDYFFQK